MRYAEVKEYKLQFDAQALALQDNIIRLFRQMIADGYLQGSEEGLAKEQVHYLRTNGSIGKRVSTGKRLNLDPNRGCIDAFAKVLFDNAGADQKLSSSSSASPSSTSLPTTSKALLDEVDKHGVEMEQDPRNNNQEPQPPERGKVHALASKDARAYFDKAHAIAFTTLSSRGEKLNALP